MVSALALSGDIVAYVVCICFFLLPLRFRFVCIFFRLLLIDGDDDDVFGIARKLAILSKHTLYAHCGFGNVVCRMWIFQCTGVGVFRIRLFVYFCLRIFYKAPNIYSFAAWTSIQFMLVCTVHTNAQLGCFVIPVILCHSEMILKIVTHRKWWTFFFTEEPNSIGIGTFALFFL